MVLDLHIFSFTKAALALPLRVSVFFAKCWIKPFVLYVRWSRALTTWSIQLVQGVIRRSLRWQFDAFFHFASYPSAFLANLVKVYATNSSQKDAPGETTNSNELMPLSSTVSREEHVMGVDGSRDVTELGNVVDHGNGGHPNGTIEVTESLTTTSDSDSEIELLGNSSAQVRSEPEPETIVVQVEQAHEVVEVDGITVNEQPKTDIPSSIPSTQDTPVTLQVTVIQDSDPSTLYRIDEVTEHEYTPVDDKSERCSSSGGDTPTEDDDGSILGGRTIEVIQGISVYEEPLEKTEVHLAETADEAHSDGGDSEKEDQDDAGFVYESSNKVFIKEEAPISDTVDFATPASIYGSPDGTGNLLVPETGLFAEDAGNSSTAHESIFAPSPSPLNNFALTQWKEELQAEETEPNVELYNIDLPDRDEEPQIRTEPISFEVQMKSADYYDIGFLQSGPCSFEVPYRDVPTPIRATVMEKEPSGDNFVPLSSLLQPPLTSETHEPSESTDSSPAPSIPELPSSPPPQESSLSNTVMLEEKTRNSEFYLEAIRLVEEIELRFGLLVVSLMTERSTAAKTWTSTSPYSQPAGPSNAVVLKLAELVPKALGEKMYDGLGEEPENVEDLLQDACQAWAAFCVQLALEHLFFGFRLRTRTEIVGILQSLSTEDPEPRQVWETVSNKSWCSPYSSSHTAELVEDVSVMGRANEDVEVYGLLEDVHQILRESDENTSVKRFKCGLHKFDRSLPTFASAADRTRDVLLYGLLEVLELAGESQIVLAIDRDRIREACMAVVQSALSLADHLKSGQGPEDVEVFSVKPETRFDENWMRAEEGEEGVVSFTTIPGLRLANRQDVIVLKPTVVLA